MNSRHSQNDPLETENRLEDHLRARIHSPQNQHPAVVHLVRLFDYGHLPAGKPRTVSAHCAGVAMELVETFRGGPELVAGLRKLLEAKDCFVRQAVLEEQEDQR